MNCLYTDGFKNVFDLENLGGSRYKRTFNPQSLTFKGAIPVNKLELVQAMKEKIGLTKEESAEIVKIFFDAITDALVNGERIEIRGLCSFYIKEYESYAGRNPKTGEQVQVAGKKLPFFKVGKELKERVNA